MPLDETVRVIVRNEGRRQFTAGGEAGIGQQVGSGQVSE